MGCGASGAAAGGAGAPPSAAAAGMVWKWQNDGGQWHWHLDRARKIEPLEPFLVGFSSDLLGKTLISDGFLAFPGRFSTVSEARRASAQDPDPFQWPHALRLPCGARKVQAGLVRTEKELVLPSTRPGLRLSCWAAGVFHLVLRPF